MAGHSQPDRPTDLDDLASQIGKEIDRARTVKKLSVSELHRITGISRTVLQGYEAGRYKPGARELRLLSEALDVSPTKLLFGREGFRDPDPLEQLLGAPDKVANVAKLSIIFAALSREEQRALLAVVSLMAEARFGGRSELAKVLSTADAVIRDAPAIFENLDAMLPAKRVYSAESAAAPVAPKAKAKPPPPSPSRPAKKPGT